MLWTVDVNLQSLSAAAHVVAERMIFFYCGFENNWAVYFTKKVLPLLGVHVRICNAYEF